MPRKASNDIVDAVETRPGHFQVLGEFTPGAEHLSHIGYGKMSALKNMSPFTEDEKYLHAQYDAGSMSCDG